MSDAKLVNHRKRGVRVLEMILTFGLAGWLGGLALFVIKSHLHDSLTKPLWVSAVLKLPNFMTVGWVLGCVVGIIIVVVQLGLVSRKREENLLFIRDILNKLMDNNVFYRMISVVFLVGLVFVWKWGSVYGKLPYAAIIVTCLLLFVSRWIVRKSRNQGGINMQAFFFSIFAALLHAGLLVILVKYSMKVVRMQGRGEKLIVYGIVLFSSALVFVFLRSCVRRFLSDSQTNGHSWRFLAGPVLILIVTVSVWPLSSTIEKFRISVKNPKNVIIIGIDTLRQDHVFFSDEGHEPSRDTTPYLRTLAQRGTVFETAISQSSWTLPAFTSILTALYPHQHGANEFTDVMSGNLVSLAEILSAAGYYTGAVVTHQFVDAEYGFAQGFDVFNEKHIAGHWDITSEYVTDEAISLIEKQKSPFFLFLHYFDPHYAFRDHQAWPFSDSYSGWLASEERTKHIRYLRANRHVFDTSDVQYLVDLYDEEIAYTDTQIGRLLDTLNRKGLDKNTMIIVVGDHGEEFMEHGWLGHGNTLYDEVIRVPLVVVLPKEKSEHRVITHTVETRAVFKTVLDYLGVSWDEYPLPSLWNVLKVEDEGSESKHPSFAFSTVWRPHADLNSGERVQMASIQSDRWKLIRDFTREREMFFDLDNDPGEKEPIEQTSEIQEEYRAVLMEWLEAVGGFRPTTARGKLDKKQIERLKSLGYF